MLCYLYYLNIVFIYMLLYYVACNVLNSFAALRVALFTAILQLKPSQFGLHLPPRQQQLPLSR